MSNGTTTPTPRVSIDDLSLAITVLESYGGDGSDAADGDSADSAARDRVVAWLAAEVSHRQDAALRRAVAKHVGLTPEDPKVDEAIARLSVS